MDERALADSLRQKGFHHTFVWQDGPDAFHPDHQHVEETAHIILRGEMTLILFGHPKRTTPANAATFPPVPPILPAWDRTVVAT